MECLFENHPDRESRWVGLLFPGDYVYNTHTVELNNGEKVDVRMMLNVQGDLVDIFDDKADFREQTLYT